MKKWAGISTLLGLFLAFAGATWTILAGEPVITGFYTSAQLASQRPSVFTHHFFSASVMFAGLILFLTGGGVWTISVFREPNSK